MKNIYIKSLIFIIVLAIQKVFPNELDINLSTIGKKELKISSDIEISIVDFNEKEFETHRSWKSKLVIKKDSQVIIEKYPIIDGYEESFIYYLVSIKKNKYIMDLNEDYYFEFAVAVDHGGNAPSTSATVFSLKEDELETYKEAWYQQEGSQEIIWDYKKAPKKHIYCSKTDTANCT